VTALEPYHGDALCSRGINRWRRAVHVNCFVQSGLNISRPVESGMIRVIDTYVRLAQEDRANSRSELTDFSVAWLLILATI